LRRAFGMPRLNPREFFIQETLALISAYNYIALYGVT
jgi:hypothetical protein